MVQKGFNDMGLDWYENHNVSNLGYYNLRANRRFNRTHPLLAKIAKHSREHQHYEFLKHLHYGAWENSHVSPAFFKEAKLVVLFMLFAGVIFVFGRIFKSFLITFG